MDRVLSRGGVVAAVVLVATLSLAATAAGGPAPRFGGGPALAPDPAVERAASSTGARIADAPTQPTAVTSPTDATSPTAPTGPTGTPSDDPVDVKLSDEVKLSRWAFVNRIVIARAKPSSQGRAVKRLTTRTPDGTAELVLTLSERTFPDGDQWVKVRLPMRPNNVTGWVPREALGDYRLVRTRLVIKLGQKRATLYRSGRRIWSAPVGIGQAQWPTPRGRFYVRDRLIPTTKNGIYGVFAFGLSAYSNSLTDWPGGGMVGVHGTNQPELIPGRISHGCVRVRNPKMAKLRKLMGVGTPVLIRR